jgi:hypothetical protein
MLNATDMIRLGRVYTSAECYLEARRQASAARIERTERLERPLHDLPLVMRMLDGAVEDAEAREARALAGLEADPRDRWDLGGCIGLVRVSP